MTPLDTLRHHVPGAIERGEREAIVEQTPAGFCKLRFVSKYHHGATAGLIFPAAALKGKTIADLSRYFPVGECTRMDRLERSPFFETWDEAFAYTFTEKPKH